MPGNRELLLGKETYYRKVNARIEYNRLIVKIEKIQLDLETDLEKRETKGYEIIIEKDFPILRLKYKFDNSGKEPKIQIEYELDLTEITRRL